jgi:hypothetical protein
VISYSGVIAGRKAVIVLAACLAAAIDVVAIGAGQAYAIAPGCETPGHYYGSAGSGTGNYGTADSIWTWSNWSVYEPDELKSFSDEAVWSIDNSNPIDSLEVGFASGWGQDQIGGDPTWTNAMVPYYTENAGLDEYDEWGTDLPADSYIYMIAGANSSGSLAYVAGVLDMNLSYVVDQPRWNMTQGETNNTETWMGGGTGDLSVNYWLNSDGDMEPWTYLNYCSNSPYWALSNNNTDDFDNGGY